MTSKLLNGAAPSRKQITGKELAAWLAHASILTKLCVAVAIATGEIEVSDLTITQIARMLGLKSKHIRAMMALSPEQRAALAFSRRRVNSTTRMSDGMVDDIIVNQVGIARALASIDRATAPKTKSNGSNGRVHA
jgi:hypothetical protein